MAQTFTLDKLVAGQLIVTKDGSDPPVVAVTYVISTQDGAFAQNKIFPYTPTAGEITTLNAFIAKLVNLIKSAEGIP